MTIDSGAKFTQAQVLLAIADFAEVFRAADSDTAYARVDVNGHKETWPVRSRGFRRWLVGRFFAIERKPPGAQPLQDALGVIEARAQFGGVVHPVWVRVAGADQAVYLDLANDAWEAVEITAAGWRVVSDASVKFRRTRGMLQLPTPAPGGSIEELRRFINVEDDAAFALVVGWAVAALRPRGPYGVLVLNGEQGTAKSTTVRVLRRLMDPNAADLRGEPRDARDLMITANNAWMITLDNVSSLPTWLSDVLCRLATGGGLATRELYTDCDEAIFDAQRPVVVNGIADVVTRSDLMDRSLIVSLPVIEEVRRRPEREFWAEFEVSRPRLLGAFLDAMSTALRRQADVRLARLPRMADLAIWVTAAAPALGLAEHTFLTAYEGNRAVAHEMVLEACPVAAAIRSLVDAGPPWTGTASQLLGLLNDRVEEAAKRLQGWPKRANHLAAILRRLAPNLRAVGVTVTFVDRPELGKERRQIEIARKVESEDRSDRSDRSGAGFDRSGLAEHRPGDRSAERSDRSEERCGHSDPLGQNDPNDRNGRIPPTLSGPTIPDRAGGPHSEACDCAVCVTAEAEVSEWTA